CWSMLRRYKYDGFGHKLSDIGIILLSPEKVEAKELIAVVRSRPYDRGDRKFDSIDDLRNYFQKNGEKEYLKLAERIRLDCESAANHNLNRLLDKPGHHI
ncbi:MAG: hypothetical protein LC657_01675, partial [Desulfobacteraceae bacterium]|nr:hypothetical protein [Desulfobacteraceae bacterium]